MVNTQNLINICLDMKTTNFTIAFTDVSYKGVVRPKLNILNYE